MQVPSEQRPRRPLVALVLASAGGALLGLTGLAPRHTALLLAAGAVGRASTRARAAGNGASLALLFALAGLQAARAAEASAPSNSNGAPARVHEGVWQPSSTSMDASFGRFRAAPDGSPWFELPPGSARAGELLRLEPGSGPRARAEGPVPALRPARRVIPVERDELERLAPARSGPLADLIVKSRARVLARCARIEDPGARGLAQALLVGDRGALDPELGDLFTRTGLRHLLAVSGMHVALFGLLFAWPLAGLGAALGSRLCSQRIDPRSLRRLLMASGLLCYAALAGGAPPVRRAALAAVLACLAPLVAPRSNGGLGRSADGLSLWCLALTLEVLAEPRALTSVGVQLSYSATLGLLLGARPLTRLTDLACRTPATFVVRAPWWQALIGTAARIGRTLRATYCASLVAAVATLPAAHASFGEWSPWGIVCTPPALLLVALALLSGWCAVLAPFDAPWLTRSFESVVGALQDLARAADALPCSPTPLPERPALAVSLSVALLVVALACSGPRARLARVLGRTGALASGLLLLPWSLAPTGVEVVALNVGHGTSVALRTPRARVWIFDAGSRDRTGVGPDALGRLLARWEAAHPAVVLSHGDRDHAAAIPWLIERYPPRLFAGARPAPIDVRLPHAVQRLDLGSAGEMTLQEHPEVLVSLLRGAVGDGNEGSRSLWVSHGGRGLLLCGDAEQEGLRDLLGLWRPPRALELLLLPHHGSHTRWLGPLLEATRPARVWISGIGPPPVGPELDRRGLDWACTASQRALRAHLARPPGTKLAALGSVRPTGPPSGASH